MKQKTCKDCGSVKSHDDFYGIQGECKECTKTRVKKHRRENESVREYDRVRAKLPHRKAHARKITVAWRKQNPQAYKAQTALGNALRDGKISKEPCTFCSTERHVHGHHRDYSRPLEVVWLCAKCHHRLHTRRLSRKAQGERRQDPGLVGEGAIGCLTAIDSHDPRANRSRNSACFSCHLTVSGTIARRFLTVTFPSKRSWPDR